MSHSADMCTLQRPNHLSKPASNRLPTLKEDLIDWPLIPDEVVVDTYAMEEDKLSPAYIRLERPYDEDALKKVGYEDEDLATKGQKKAALRPPSFHTDIVSAILYSIEHLAAAPSPRGYSPSSDLTKKKLTERTKQENQQKQLQDRLFYTGQVAQEPITDSLLGLTANTHRNLTAEDTANATTLVVQNLPSRFSQEEIIRVWPIDGSYDFLHLPYNVLQKRPLGFAFINFANAELAAAFKDTWNGKMLPDGRNKRPLDIRAAEVQGKEENLALIKSRKLGKLAPLGFLPVVVENGAVLSGKAILAKLAARHSSKIARSRGSEDRTTTGSSTASSSSASSSTSSGRTTSTRSAASFDEHVTFLCKGGSSCYSNNSHWDTDSESSPSIVDQEQTY